MNLIDKSKLSQSSLDLPPSFRDSSGLHGPTIAVLLSLASETNFKWTTDDLKRTFKHIERLLKVHECRVILTCSQETPLTIRNALESWLQSIPKDRRNQIHYVIPESISSPEGILASATHVAVTADSTMLTSESLASGRPTYIIGHNRCTGTLEQFNRNLIDIGRVRMFMPSRAIIAESGDFMSDIGEHPERNEEYVDEAQEVAKKVRWLMEGHAVSRTG
ncbi:hypothetical protein HK097_003428 [Rhizophlyctis rosea]|uniref:Uncharacterized protein n=1 Tax=Rhizophlyctis rosea TaxID=64517 RepID=A0AAD5X029_9FUNG|nr:hypothetical protein HK097_003428 [Rhizophlyctis rosea]